MICGCAIGYVNPCVTMNVPSTARSAVSVFVDKLLVADAAAWVRRYSK